MKIYMDTMGCPKNIVDSENAAGLLAANGHSIVDSPEKADCIIVNTCGFINDAKQESIARILELAEYKKGGSACTGEKGAYLIVTGCLSQRYIDELPKAMPEVDAFLGVNDYETLPAVLSWLEKQNPKECRKPFALASCESAAYPDFGSRRRSKIAPWTAYLKIAEGCNNVCAYCIIPAIRGRFRSRPMESVLAEANQLAKEGVQELVLVAQDTTAYGMDWDGKYHLTELLREICKIDGIRWIRLLYCYEDRITDDLIECIRSEEKICKYIDIPLQHASSHILKLMKRRSTFRTTERTLDKLRRAIPDLVVRTTLMTGFPGETKEDFEILYDFVEKQRFHRLGVFAFSKEEGTAAAEMDHQVRKDVKERRRDKIMALQQEISLEHNRAYIGKTLEVLVEEVDEQPEISAETPVYAYIGRTRYDAPEIDNSVLFTSPKRIPLGSVVPVAITDAYDYDLVGQLA